MLSLNEKNVLYDKKKDGLSDCEYVTNLDVGPLKMFVVERYGCYYGVDR